MPLPLVSVVIPTYGRPSYLPTAVTSAIEGMGDDVEVIVVPNGSDESWRQSLASFVHDPRIRVEPIVTAHANVARNHGMVHAQGKYLRFLDDDDYLIPEGAKQQYTLMEHKGFDICSGWVSVVDNYDHEYCLLTPTATTDFIEASLSANALYQPTAHVYRRSLVQKFLWDPSIHRYQDVHWIHLICRNSEVSWSICEKRVGVWRHHISSRMSVAYSLDSNHRNNVRWLIETSRILEQQGRLNKNRKIAATEAIWKSIHLGFPMSPLYWTKMAKQVQSGDISTKPEIFILKLKVGTTLVPIFLEWILLVPRWISRIVRITIFQIRLFLYRQVK